MRVLLCLMFAITATPVLAAQSLADQAAAAYSVFAGGLSQQAFLGAQYGDNLFKNIGGNWVRLNGPDPKTGIETYGADTDKFCKGQAAVTLSSTSALTLTLTTNLKGPNFTQQYVLIAGSTFGEYTDPAAYLGAVGLGPDKTGQNFDQQRALILSLANGLLQIYRPSADVLVMTRDRGYPIVLARCPVEATDTTSPPPTPETVPPNSSSEAPSSSQPTQ